MTTREMEAALDAELAVQHVTVEDVPAGTTAQDWYYAFLVDMARVSAAEYEAMVAAIDPTEFAASRAPVIVAALRAGAPAGITHYGHASVEILPAVSRTNANGVTRRRAQSIVVHAYGW